MSSDNDGELHSRFGPSRMPSLAGLRCFEAAARLENFSRAADELHLTHGAISRAVRTLEEDLGVALFERRSRRVFLTDAGRRLYRAAHDGFALIQEAARELRTPPRDTPLVLSCEPTLLMRWLIPRWPAFQATHPDISVHLVAGGGPFSFGDGIDLAIRRNDFAWPGSLHATPLFAERIGPVCRPDKVDTFFDNASAARGIWSATTWPAAFLRRRSVLSRTVRTTACLRPRRGRRAASRRGWPRGCAPRRNSFQRPPPHRGPDVAPA